MIRQKTLIPLLLAALMAAVLLGAMPAAAQGPTLPHAFLGTVEIAGKPAPVYTQVEGRGTNVVTGLPGNPLVTDEVGKYGRPGGFDPKLIVQGSDLADGAAIAFYVNGVKAQCAGTDGVWKDSYPFKAGGVTILNLRVQSAAPVLPTPTATASPTTTSTPTRTPTYVPVTPRPTSSTPTATAAPGTTPLAAGATAAPGTTPLAAGATATPRGQATAPAAATTVPPTVTPASMAIVETPTPQGGAAQASATPTAAALAQAPSPTAAATAAATVAVPPTATLPPSSPTLDPVVTRATGQPILGTSEPSGSGSAQPTPPAGGSPLPCSVPVVGVIILAGGGAALYRRRSG